MKNLIKINLLIAIFIYSLVITARAESSDKINAKEASDNSYEMLMIDNTSIDEFNDFSLVPAYNLFLDINDFLENDLILEKTLELEEWMLDYKWVEAEESSIEEEIELEVWMQRPKNWNIYQCDTNSRQ